MLNVPALRQQFPALSRLVEGRTPIYLDGPGGTQVPRSVIDAIVDYLSRCNANHGGVFTTSRESDEILHSAHAIVADFVNGSAEEIVFGQNMTSLTFHLSRCLAKTWNAGDAIVVTRLDHDANVRPWVLAAEDAGVEVRWVSVDRENGTLDLDDLTRKLSGKVRLLALTCASNAIGTMPDVRACVELAHRVGALVHLDAVHYAPHGVIDVKEWNCDFLGCSAYKFFGPHVGILWGRQELLESLRPYKVRPATDTLPGKWMTGTQNHEGIAGVKAAVEYLLQLGIGGSRRERIVAAMSEIRQYEMDLARQMLRGLRELTDFRLYGLCREEDVTQRTPTFAITHATKSASEVAAELAKREIYVWAGNFYAWELANWFEVENRGGFVRLGLVHYNTPQEVEQTLAALKEI
jgi:cysteine desulfurase family protein (TIGR01976 family)